MTLGDFMLGILGSFIATLLLKACKSWRPIYRESLKGVLLLTSLLEQKLTLRRLRLTASAFMVIATALVFLSQSPKLASDDLVQKTPKPQKILTSRGVMRPCVPEDYSACAPRPVKRKDEVNITIHRGPVEPVDVRFIAAVYSR